MERLRRLTPDELDGDAKVLYEKITAGPRAGGPVRMVDDAGALVGPFNAMLLRPGMGEALQELGAAVRYRSSLTPRAREIAILVVAHHWDSAFEQYAHETLGRAAGLTGEELDALRAGAPLELADPREAAVLRVARALVTRADLDEEEYAALAESVVFELTTLVGYYATLALQMRVFRVSP